MTVMYMLDVKAKEYWLCKKMSSVSGGTTGSSETDIFC